MCRKHIKSSQIVTVVPALLLALVLASCGSSAASQSGAARATPQQGTSAQPAGGAAALDSCALLTRADAEALLGAAVAAPSANQIDSGDPNSERAVSQCLYRTNDEATRSVSVVIRRGAPGEHARDGLRQICEQNMLGGTLDLVAGLGDEALWNHGGDADQLNVASGPYLLIASADLGKGVPTLEISKAAARRVLARLP